MIRPPAILQRFPRPILLLLASIVWAASASAQPFVDFEVIGDEGLKDVPALDGWMPPAGANVGPDNNYAQAMVVKDMGGGKQCVFVGTNRSWQANSAAQLGFLNGQGFVYPDFSIPGPSNDLRPLDDNAAWADANRSAIFRGCGYAGGAVTWDEVYRSPIVQSVVVAQQGSPPSVGIGDVPAFNSFRAGIEYKGWIVMGGGVGYAPGYTLVGSPTGEPGSWVHIETPNGVPSDTRALTKFKNRFCFGGGLDLTNPPLGNPGSNHIYCTKYLSANPNWTRVTPASGGPTAPGEGNVLLGAITEAGGKMFAGFANREGFQVWTFLPNFWNPYQGIWWKQVDKGAGEMANVLPGGFTKGLGDHVYMTTLNFPLGLADGSLFNCFFNPQNDPIQCLAGALKGAEMIKFITQQNMLWDPYVLVIGDKYAKLPPPGTEGQVRIPTSGFPSGMGNPLNAYFWTQQRVGPWYSSEMVVGTFDTTGLFAGFEGFAGLPQEIQDLLEDIVVPSIQGADLFRKTSSGWELLDFNGLTTDHNTGHRTSGFMHGKLLLGTTNSDVGFQVLRQENGLEGIPIHWPLGPGVPLPLEDLAEWLQMLLNGQLQN